MNKPFVKIIRNGPGEKIHKAKTIILNPWHIIENGYVKVENNIISQVSKEKIKGTKILDHGSGIIMPGLFNAHIHLELCAFKNKISFNHGFRKWVAELLKQRNIAKQEELENHAENGLNNLIKSGTLFAGEISTLGITKNIVKNSDIFGIWFQEFIGSINQNQKTNLINKFRKKLHFSLAGHGPHTCSPQMLQKLKQYTKSQSIPFSIHLAESDDETEFITTGKGKWGKFLKQRKIDFSKWDIPEKSPVKYLDKLGILNKKTLAVHLLNTDLNDLEIIAKKDTKPILCPRSNFNLHKKLPDISRMLKLGLKPALGTDSLASTDTLSIFDEMKFVSENFPDIDPLLIFSMATINGAKAFNMEKFAGTIESGKTGDFIYIPLETNNLKNIFEKVVTYE